MPSKTVEVADPDVAPVSPARAFWGSLERLDARWIRQWVYIFVLVPALIDLLHRGGLEASKGNIAQYGGYLFSIFMLGWACW